MKKTVAYRPSDRSCTEVITDPDLTGDPTTTFFYVNDVPGITQGILESTKDKEFATLTDSLRASRDNAIEDTMRDFVSRHVELTGARHVVDLLDLTRYVTYMDDLTIPAGRFVGIEMQIIRSSSLAVIMHQVGTQFDQLQPGLTLYLFESSQQQAIATMVMSNTQSKNLQWFESAFQMMYRSSTLGTGQFYYLGYFEDDLRGAAVDTRLYSGCSTCGNEATQIVATYSKYVLIRGVEFQSSALNGIDLPNLKQKGISDSTYGLHFRMTITCDITDYLCNNKSLFASPIRRKIAIKHFWDFINSTNLNRNQSLAKDNALLNVEREEKLYDKEMKAIKLSFTDIDKICMPCDKSMIKTYTAR